MKKQAKPKAGRKPKSERPVELDRGWHELEQQHDRLKSDWMSLAAMIGSAEDRGRSDPE